MKKNPERTEARRTEIINAARELFFEKGFEATSIRMIQNRVGKQVAVFYYYFESKSQVFDEAIKLTLKDYHRQMEETVRSLHESAEKDLTRLLQYVERENQIAREKYGESLHWSVEGAIRSHVIGLMKIYTKEILDYYLERGELPNMTMDASVVSNILSYSFGGGILYEEKESFRQHQDQLFQLLPMLLGTK